jgi:senataxin
VINSYQKNAKNLNASSGKILLCAPSNAAIDEMASRIHAGTYKGKKPENLKVVRIGAKSAMSGVVQEISLDSLVDAKIEKDQASTGKTVDAGMEIQALKQEIEALKATRAQKERERESTEEHSPSRQALINEISQLRSRQTTLIRDLNRRRDENQSRIRDLDAKRRTFRMDVLQDADVICSTLSGAALDLLGGFDFEMIIIDEAAQAVELSTLIPLKYKSTRCVMVGDPQQLPPTVISQEASPKNSNLALLVYINMCTTGMSVSIQRVALCADAET